MQEQEWLDKFIENKDVLLDMIKVYHPSNCQQHNLKITAPDIEAVRLTLASIVENLPDIEQLILDEDVPSLYSILSETWMGMPESTEVRNKAFFILCSLLDN